MKICIAANNINPCAGWGRLVLNVSRELKKAGHEVGFILDKGEPEKNTLIIPMKLEIGKFFSLWRSLSKIRHFVTQYDIVVCYDINPHSIVVSLAALGLKIKIVAYAIATYSLLAPGNFLKNFLIRWAYDQADHIWVVSDFVRQQIEKSGYKMKACKVVPVGVDVDFFKKSFEQKDSPIVGPYILSVGALKYRKGFHLSIPAFAEIVGEFPDLKYIIIGDQDMGYFGQMRDLAEEYGIKDRIVFLEKVSDEKLLRYYHGASLFILTPVTTPEALEGFGMVYLEAGACGKAVVGTLDSGAEAAIVDGFNGLLAEPEISEIASAMRRILNDKELAGFLGQNGIARAAEFSWPKVAQIQIENLLWLSI